MAEVSWGKDCWKWKDQSTEKATILGGIITGVAVKGKTVNQAVKSSMNERMWFWGRSMQQSGIADGTCHMLQRSWTFEDKRKWWWALRNSKQEKGSRKAGRRGVDGEGCARQNEVESLEDDRWLERFAFYFGHDWWEGKWGLAVGSGYVYWTMFRK